MGRCIVSEQVLRQWCYGFIFCAFPSTYSCTHLYKRFVFSVFSTGDDILHTWNKCYLFPARGGHHFLPALLVGVAEFLVFLDIVLKHWSVNA